MNERVNQGSGGRLFSPGSVALLYAALAVVWILASGAVLTMGVSDPVLQQRIELGKGLLFVLVTSGVLYAILRQWQKKASPAGDLAADGAIAWPWRILACVVLLGTVPLAGLMVVKIQLPQVEREAFSNLAAIADLKVVQIRRWLKERYNDGEVIMAVAAPRRGRGQPLEEDANADLAALIVGLRYDTAAWVDPAGKPWIVIGGYTALPETLALLPQALAGGQPLFSDVISDAEGRPHFDLVVPLFQNDGGRRRPAGAVILRDSPERFLFPYLRHWPTAHVSGETLLLRREGDSISFIDAPQQDEKGDGARRLVPGADSLFFHAVGAGEDGWQAQGLDERGVPALAVFRPIEGTPWTVAVKLDRAEVMRPLYDLAFWVGLITLLAISVVGAVMVVFWRQRARTHQLEILAQSTQLMRQFYDLPFIGISMSSPATERWLRCNDRFCEIMGYAREELLGLSWRDLTHPDDMAAGEAENERVRRGESDGFTLDKRFVRQDGSTVHVNLEVRCVRRPDGSPEYLLSMVQDISERKRAEERIRRLTQLYAALSECNQSIVRSLDEEELFPRVCRAAVEFGGMKMAWIGMIDGTTQRVRPVAAYGEDTSWLESAEVSCDVQSPFGGGSAGTAVREQRPVWIDDFLNSPVTAPWRSMAEKTGYRSSCALPLRRDGEIVGAFMLYRGEHGPFDDEQRRLLCEMAEDIGFALTNFSRERARQEAQRRLDRLTHMYAALSECNQAIVRCSSEEELFPQICRFAVQYGGMRMAWIGRVDEDARCVVPVASHGQGTEYLQGVTISIDAASPHGLGAMGTAIRERRLSVVQDYLNDPRTAPWRDRAVQAGWRGAAAVPLLCGGKVVGSLALLADETEAFDDEIGRLLTEMALDISFALDLFARESERVRMEAALRESESRFRNLYEKAPLAYQSLDADGNLLEVNEAWLKLFGRIGAEVIGRFVGEFMSEASLATFREEFPQFRRRGRIDGLMLEFVKKDGRHCLMMVNGLVSRDKDGRFLRTHCMMTDLTERMHAEEQLRLAAKVFEQGGEGVMITDDLGNIVMVNRAFEAITGYAQEEVIGRNPRFLSSGRHDREFYRTLWSVINTGGFWQGEIWNRRKDGDVYPQYLSVSRVVDETGRTSHYIGTFNDISESKASQEHIQRLAHYDSLTGLPNRMLLADRVGLALHRMDRCGEPLALIFLDLDRFKNVNDSLGHRIGDELLIQVANRLKELLREEDTVSRLGGDEFILVLPGADANGAVHVAGKVLKELSLPYRIEQYELSVTPSLGIAMYPADGETYESLSKCADTAMYRAKRSGRQTFCFFTREMQESSDRLLRVENALRKALERDQLSLVFQPQIALDSGRVIGVEALLRWRHPELGDVPPGDFIPVAEDSGMILPIGEWVLRSAVNQLRDWLDRGLPAMVMAVNLSAIQFRQAGLPDLVSQVLAEAELPPELLELELTEGAAMENPREAVEILNALYSRGVRVSIDDFGTGYSSLNYLKRFKVYRLKIDQSFVRDIARDPEDEAIVEAIIGLARSLRLQTIAEGVETPAQAAFLQSRGCNEGQGFLYGRPMPAEAFERFVRAAARD